MGSEFRIEDNMTRAEVGVGCWRQESTATNNTHKLIVCSGSMKETTETTKTDEEGR